MNTHPETAPTVLITGANRGLGLEFTRRLLMRGARVLAACREPARADRLHALSDDAQDRLEILALDVASPTAISALAKSLGKRNQPLDWLINNAGVLPSGERFGEIDADVLDHSVRVNALAPFLLVQSLAPLLRRGRSPRVANVSSVLGSMARCDAFRTPSYAIAKAALNMASVLLARALAPDGVRVVALHPGWVKTDMGGPDAELDRAVSVDGMLDTIERLTPETDGAFLDYRGEPVPW